MLRRIKLIIEREYLVRVKKLSFIIMTLLFPILIASILAISVWASLNENKTQNIIVVDDNYPAFQHIKNETKLNYIYQDISLEKAKKLLKEEVEGVTAVMYLPKNILASNTAKFYVNDMPNAITQRRIEKQIENIIEGQKLLAYKISPKLYTKINTEFKLSPYKIQEGKDTKIDREKAYVGWFFAIAIYMMIFMYATMVMRGVIEEKVNRIVEVIISTVKPFELMMGKVIGVALVGLTQFVLWAVLTLILFIAAQYFFFDSFYNSANLAELQMTAEVAKQSAASFNTDQANHILSRINFSVMIPLFLFYFLGGYLLYSALFAAVGAMIDNESDTQQFILPLTLPLTLALYLSQSIINNPDSSLAFFTSIFPLTSPIIMMILAAIGMGSGVGIPYWQVALSMGLLIFGFVLTIFIGAKIYRGTILMQGKNIGFKDVFRLFK